MPTQRNLMYPSAVGVEEEGLGTSSTDKGRYSAGDFDLGDDTSNSYYLLPPPPAPSGGKLAPKYDTELSIFDAQKYFSENSAACAYPKQHHQLAAEQSSSSYSATATKSSVNRQGNNNKNTDESHHHHSLGLVLGAPRSRGSSEVSWNSQARLLANHHQQQQPLRKHESKKHTWMILGGIRKPCCCAGEKSIGVRKGFVTADTPRAGMGVAGIESNSRSSRNNSCEKRDEIAVNRVDPHKLLIKTTVRQPQDFAASQVPILKQPQTRLSPGISFPVLEKPTPMLIEKKKKIILEDDDRARDSIEVFQPPNYFKTASPPVKRLDDDVGSDASSDLFEIESFSTSIPGMYRTIDGETPRKLAAKTPYERSCLEEPQTPSIAATDCYPPSEVSVVWSVATVEGRASLSNISASASDVGEEASFQQRMKVDMAADAERRTAPNAGGLLLMNCRQEKAVNVGPRPVNLVSAGGPVNFPLHIGGRPPRSERSQHSGRMPLAFVA